MIGIDFYKTISTNPKLFKRLAESYMSSGYPVYIVSAVALKNVSKLRENVKKSKVPHTHLEIVIFDDYEDIAPLKLAACKRLGIKVMYDDMESVCTLLAANDICTLQVR